MTSIAVAPHDTFAAILSRAEKSGRSVLLEHEVYALLAAAGIHIPRHRFVVSPDEIDDRLCAGLGDGEIVVKIVSPQILHKSDAGGIAFCDNTPSGCRDAVADVIGAARRAMPEANLLGALLVEKIAFRAGLGREILAGFRHDRAFGPVVFAGVGGLDTEYLLRVLQPRAASAIRSAIGLTRDDALAMLRGTVVHDALCGGLRSAKHGAIGEDELADLIVSLAQTAETLAGFTPPGGLGLTELEVNPFVVSSDGRLVALDGLARTQRPDTRPAPRPIASLRHLLTPASAVVVGASAESVNVGRTILRNLVKGGGIAVDRISVIHPRAESIDGCRAFPTLAALPEPADMAVVAVPADRGAERAVIDIVENKLARTVTLISGGFGETEGGRGAEARMREAIDRGHRAGGGVLVNGGNCLGIISVPGGYNTFFLPDYKLPFNDAPGQNVASISQSGAYLVSQISNLDRMVRARYAISFGNQIDLTASDYLEYLEQDRAVSVFAVYIEGFSRGDGVRFLEIARRLAGEGKTILLYKAGRTTEGRAAAASHTAAVVGDYDVCVELVRAAGVIDCVTLDMFEDYLMTFSFLAGRQATGRRTAILSNAGFECTAAADKLYGLELASLSADTRSRLRELLPSVVDVHNPTDATPTTSTENYAQSVEALAADPNVDALVIAGVPATPYLENLARGEGHGEDIAHESSLPSRLIRIFQASSKPMVFSVDSGALYEPSVQMMKRAGLPCFRKVDRATRALGAYVERGRASDSKC